MGTGESGGASARVRRRRLLDGCRWAGLFLLMLACSAPLYEVDSRWWAVITEGEARRGKRSDPTPRMATPLYEWKANQVPSGDHTGFGDALSSLVASDLGRPDILLYPMSVPRRTPAILVLAWFAATLGRHLRRGLRQLLRLVLALTTIGFAAAIAAGAWRWGDYVLGNPGSPSMAFATPVALAVLIAAFALFPPRRRIGHDPMPWAASAALACGLWMGVEVIAHLVEAPAAAFRPGGMPRAGMLIPPSLLLFALPSYLPRRRRRDRLGAPTLAAPAVPGAAS